MSFPFSGRALERVLCFGDDDITGLDLQHRVGIGPIDIVVTTLPRLAQMMRLPGGASGRAPAGHDGIVEPAHLAPSNPECRNAAPTKNSTEARCRRTDRR